MKGSVIHPQWQEAPTIWLDRFPRPCSLGVYITLSPLTQGRLPVFCRILATVATVRSFRSLQVRLLLQESKEKEVFLHLQGLATTFVLLVFRSKRPARGLWEAADNTTARPRHEKPEPEMSHHLFPVTTGAFSFRVNSHCWEREHVDNSFALFCHPTPEIYLLQGSACTHTSFYAITKILCTRCIPALTSSVMACDVEDEINPFLPKWCLVLSLRQKP